MFSAIQQAKSSSFRLWIFLNKKLRRMPLYKRGNNLTVPDAQLESDVELGQQPQIPRYIPSSHGHHAYGLIFCAFTSLPTRDDAKSLYEIRFAPRTTVAALHEGHGTDGRAVAAYLANNFHRLVCQNVVGGRTKIDQDAMQDAYQLIETALLEEATANRISRESGATSAIIYIKSDEVVISNIGDTVVFVGRPSLWNWRVKTQSLSEKHSVENASALKELKERLAGHDEEPVTYTPNEGLSLKGITKLTRALANFNLKDNELSDFTLTAPLLGHSPYTKVVPRSVDDKFFVLASSVVFDFLSEEEIGKIIVSRLNQREDVAKWLIEATLHEAKACGTAITTDIAIVVVFIDSQQVSHNMGAQSNIQNYGPHLENYEIRD